jgi:WD40 repeat protein
VRIWSSIRDQESSVLSGHALQRYGDTKANFLSWSPDGKRLASAGEDGEVRIWDSISRKELLSSKPQCGAMPALAWSPDSAQLAAAAVWAGKFKVWDVANGREVFAQPADPGLVTSLAWSPDGTRLSAGLQDGTIRVVELLKGAPKVHVFKAHQEVSYLAWSPQGDRLASGAGWAAWTGGATWLNCGTQFMGPSSPAWKDTKASSFE